MASRSRKNGSADDDEVTKQRLLTNQYEKEQRMRLQTWIRQSKKKQQQHQKKNKEDEEQEQEDDDDDSKSSHGLDTADASVLPLSSGGQYDAARRRLQTKSIKVPEALLMYRNRHQVADFRRRLPEDLSSSSSEGTLLRLPPVSRSRSEEAGFVDRSEREEDSTSLRLPIMFPADEAVRRALYEGTTKEGGRGKVGGGRADYLFRRNLRRPESRYRFPVVSSWAYGWNVRDVVPEEEQWKKAENRRRNLVQDTFYARNGINLASQ